MCSLSCAWRVLVKCLVRAASPLSVGMTTIQLIDLAVRRPRPVILFITLGTGQPSRALMITNTLLRALPVAKAPAATLKGTRSTEAVLAMCYMIARLLFYTLILQARMFLSAVQKGFFFFSPTQPKC